MALTSGNMLLIFLATALPPCDGNRIIADNLFSCPGAPELNVKGDCVDKDARVVAPSCCDDLRRCRDEVANLDSSYEPRLDLYIEECQLEEDDLVPGEDGSFDVADSTRLCSESCKSIAELATPVPHADLAALAECKKTRAAAEVEALEQKVAMLGALDVAWSMCNPDTTTAKAPEVAIDPDCANSSGEERLYWTRCGIRERKASFVLLPGLAGTWGQCKQGDRQIRAETCGIFRWRQRALCQDRTCMEGPYWNGRCAHCENPAFAHGLQAGVVMGVGAAALGMSGPLGWAALAFGAAALSTAGHCPPGYDAIDFRPCAGENGTSSNAKCEVQCQKNLTASAAA